MGLFKKLREKRELERKIEEERTINEKNYKLFISSLSVFNNTKKDSVLRLVKGYRLYQTFNNFSNDLKERIKIEKGEPLILLLKNISKEFLSQQEKDSTGNKLENIPSKKLKMYCVVKDHAKKGFIFIDANNNAHIGDFYNVHCYNFAQEYYTDGLYGQEISITMYTDDVETETYIYYSDLDILLKKTSSYYHISNEERYSIDGQDMYGSSTIVSDYYRIEYNISKKVSLFDHNYRLKNKIQYQDTIKYLQENGINVFTSEIE